MKEFINRRQRENESVEEYAGHLKRLLPKAFPQLKEQADDILLQQFKAGIRQGMIKFTILRSAPDSFEKAVKIAAREELMINQVTASTASASVVTSDADVKKETTGHEGETGSAAAIHAEQPGDIDKLAMKEKSPPQQEQKPFRNDAVGLRGCGTDSQGSTAGTSASRPGDTVVASVGDQWVLADPPRLEHDVAARADLDCPRRPYCRHRDGLTAEEGATQVLVPRALRSEIMRSLHNSRYAGHLGERRTLSRTRSRFY
ncbi:hypothetical protein T08_14101 [Trichinella sp. T8]|nr:hypothetical protein T08_14101 [Trichinella sp. T8]